MRVGRLARIALASVLTGGLLPAARAADEALLAPDDSVVVVRNNDIVLIGAGGKGARQLTTSPDRELGIAACPDGSAVVFEAFDTQRNEFAVYVVGTDGINPRRVVPVGHSPSWSPDGGRLLYTANVRGGYDVFMCNRNGGNTQRLTDTPGSELYPVWSPDGTRIAYLRDRTDGSQRSVLVVLRDALGKETELATLVGVQATRLAWSPGTDLLLSGRVTETNGTRDLLYQIKAEPSKAKALTEGLDSQSCGSWLSGGRGLLFNAVSRSTARPVVQPLGGASRNVPGTEAGDSEPCILPGPSTRAPQVFVSSRRSFYLPVAELVGDEVFLPLGELAKQLGWQIAPEGDLLKLTRGDTTLTLNPTDGTLTAGETKTTLTPAPKMVAGALMAPARALAGPLAANCEWDGQARVLRLSNKEVPNAPTGRPQG